MRNMDKDKKLRWAMDPRSEERTKLVNSLDITTLTQAKDISLGEELPPDESSAESAFTEVAPGQFMCTSCGKLYKQIGSLIKHLKSNHKITDIVSFRCDKCNTLFESKQKLTKHKQRSKKCSE